MVEVPKVKICGITRRADAEFAAAQGAAYLGMILSAGFGRSVPEEQAPAIVAGLTATPVAVVVDEAPEDAARLATAVGAGVIQLHGNESPESVARLAGLGPWRLWKAVRAADALAVRDAAARYAGLVHGFLVEGFVPGAVGGAGARLSPEVGALRSRLPRPLTLIVAGGLTPDNVAEAVARHQPDVVDVSSGVESALGVKDPLLVSRFIQEAHRPASPAPSSNPHSGDPS